MCAAAPTTIAHAAGESCTAMTGGLYRDGAAMNGRAAAQPTRAFTAGCGGCTAMCRDLPRLRGRTGAGVRTQERDYLQWDVSRYSAAHAAQNRPRPRAPFPPVRTRLAYVASGAPAWPTIPSVSPIAHVATGAGVPEWQSVREGLSKERPYESGKASSLRGCLKANRYFPALARPRRPREQPPIPSDFLSSKNFQEIP